jgi:GNAT superfamily N-acetyltransferase
MLLTRGGVLSDTYQVLARELISGARERLTSGEISIELVHDERTFEAATFIESTGWNRSALDEAEASERFAKTLKDLKEWDGFQLVAFVNGEPASTGRCTLNGEVARLWGAVTLPDFRHRGCYRALLSERLRLSQEHGATLALTRGRPMTSGPILIRAGFTAHSEERCYRIKV